MQRGTPVRDALMAETNQPCIVVFRDCDDDEDTPPQFFISIEQQLMLQSPITSSRPSLAALLHSTSSTLVITRKLVIFGFHH